MTETMSLTNAAGTLVFEFVPRDGCVAATIIATWTPSVVLPPVRNGFADARTNKESPTQHITTTERG